MSTDKLLTDAEVDRLILATVEGQGQATEADMRRVIEWAEQTRADAALLSLVLRGAMFVKADGKELTFRAVCKKR